MMNHIRLSAAPLLWLALTTTPGHATPDACDGWGRLEGDMPLDGDTILTRGAAPGLNEPLFGRSISLIGDFNGDGLPDLAVGAPRAEQTGALEDQGVVLVYPGPDLDADDSTPEPDPLVILFGGAEGVRIGKTVAPAGDVDGDGYADLIVGRPDANPGNHVAWIVSGAPQERTGVIEEEASVELTGPGMYFGRLVAGVGDVDGDGFDDVAVADDEAVHFFRGPLAAHGEAPTFSVTGVRAESIVDVGDVDGDGHHDIAIGEPDANGRFVHDGRVLLLLDADRATDVDASAIPAVILGDATSALGTAIARAGDVDGDGVDDLWVTARRYRSNRGAAYLVPGGAHLAARNEVDAVSATRITGETPDAALGESIAGDVDFDADGQRDVLIGSPGWYDAGWHVGAAYAMHGPFASGPPSGSHLRMTGTSPSALGPLSALKVGQSVAAGDVDGDGFDDVFVASPRGTDDSGSAGDPTSRVVLLHGGHDVIDAAPWYLDGDGDGYGDDATAVYACAPVPGRVALAGDCDDTLPAFHPGAPETDCANPEDRNCDGSRGMQDRDADGAAACLGDCDDRDSHQRPGGAEKCSDGLDNDCNGAIDDALATDATRWYPDSDHDGYGDAGLEIRACTQPALFLEPPVLVGGDCNDANASIHPAALELCNTIDDDCDGTVDVDASDPPHWYEDQDGDRFGDPHAWIAACTKPAGYVVDSGDCDDSDAELRPGTREVCDGVDNDCDGRGYLAGVQVAWDARVTGVAGTRFGQSIAWIADRGDGQSAWIVGGTKASEAIRRISPPLPGGDRSLDQASSLTLLSCPNDLPSCGAGVTRGDLDGDGFDDLVVTSPDADGPGAVDRGRVAVYRGPLDHPLGAADRWVVLEGTGAGSRLGAAIAVRDVDGDGRDDLLIGAPGDGGAQRNGGAWLWYGRAASAPTVQGIATAAAAWIAGDAGQRNGASVALGDFDGDGFVDLASARAAARGEVALRIARGAAARFAGGLTPSTIVRANQATLELGRRLSAIGDFDGDGREDLAVADNRSAWILYGGAWPATGTLDGVPHTNITSTRAAEALGHAIAAAGDADGDGFGDLLITAPGTDQGDYTNAGAAYLVYGSPRRQAVAPVQQLTDLLAARHGPPAGAMFYGDESQLNLGQAIAAGDVDGDGYPELAVTSADYLARSGRVHIVRTGPHGVDIEPVRDVPFSYTPVIDGNDDDWVPDTILADTWGDPWMVSWSPTRLSFGFEPANYSALGALYRLVVYLGNGDGQGATQGITVGSQRPALPVRMDIAVVIKANGADPNVYVANPSTGAWTLSTIPLTFARDPNNALELSLPATAIPGDRLDVAGVWIYTGANASVTNGYPSDAVTAGFDADITRWLSLDRSRAEGPAWVTTSPGGSYPSLDDEQSDFWLDLDRDGEGQDGPPMHVCPIHVPIDPATQATLAVTDPELATDCNDLDPTIFFNALDPVGDGIDSDCDGVDGMTRVRPVVTSCVITPGDADTSDDLTAFAAAEAPEGGPVTWAYRWRVDGALQTDVSGPVLPADRTVRGAEIVVECMPRNGNGRGLPVSSTPVEIHNAVPQATLCTMSPNPPIGGIPATGSMAAWDDDGDPITWTVSWQVDGAATSSGPSLDGSHFGVGDQVAIVCTPSDGIDAGPALAPPACTAVSNDRPTIASASVGPAILSAATTLTCDHPAAADVDGDPIAAYAYTWTVNGAVVATTATLPEGAVHRGDVVSCAVAASDPWGTGSPTSAAPRTVENAPPPQPIVSIAPGPEPTLAQDMRCDVVPDGTDEDGDPVTYAISWTFAGAAWTGATATTTLPGDTIRAADSEAGAWRCTVTPSDGFVPGTPGVANATVRLALGGTTPHPIVAGGDTTCSLTQTGQVRCWGYGTNGARATPYTSPVGKVPGDMGNNLTPSDFGPIDVATIVQGATHTCALTTDGKVKCAGAGTTGQLGNGSTNALGDTPDELGAGLPFVNLGATAVVADLVAGDGSTCALMTDGRMKCWGYNHSARLGLGDLNNRGDDPNEMGDALPYVNVGTNRKVVAVALSGTSTCALRDDNKVVCWGASGQGALGYPTPPAPAAIGDAPAEMGDALVAVDVGPGTILDIVGGTGFACVLFKDGRVKCWGSNSFGQLGLESTTHRGDDAGEMGTALPAVNLGTGAKAARLSSGGVVTCAVLQDARVKCWGGGGTASGYYLGYGDNSGRGSVVGTMGDALPSVAIPGGGSVANVSVSVGLARHTCVATTCGAVWCWGNNNSGQLGIGNSTTQRAPITAVDLGTGLYADVDRAPTCP